MSRSGKIFYGPEAGAGLGGGPSFRGGWILDSNDNHSDAEVDSFVEGGFVNAGGGFYGCDSVNISSDGRISGEFGVQAGGGGSLMYGSDLWTLPWTPFSW